MKNKVLTVASLLVVASLPAWSHSNSELSISSEDSRFGKLQNLHIHTRQNNAVDIAGQVRHGQQHRSVRGHVDLIFKDASGRILAAQKLALSPTAWLNRSRHHARFSKPLSSIPTGAVEMVVRHDLAVHD